MEDITIIDNDVVENLFVFEESHVEKINQWFIRGTNSSAETESIVLISENSVVISLQNFILVDNLASN